MMKFGGSQSNQQQRPPFGQQLVGSAVPVRAPWNCSYCGGANAAGNAICYQCTKPALAFGLPSPQQLPQSFQPFDSMAASPGPVGVGGSFRAPPAVGRSPTAPPPGAWWTCLECDHMNTGGQFCTGCNAPFKTLEMANREYMEQRAAARSPSRHRSPSRARSQLPPYRPRRPPAPAGYCYSYWNTDVCRNVRCPFEHVPCPLSENRVRAGSDGSGSPQVRVAPRQPTYVSPQVPTPFSNIAAAAPGVHTNPGFTHEGRFGPQFTGDTVPQELRGASKPQFVKEAEMSAANVTQKSVSGNGETIIRGKTHTRCACGTVQPAGHKYCKNCGSLKDGHDHHESWLAARSLEQKPQQVSAPNCVCANRHRFMMQIHDVKYEEFVKLMGEYDIRFIELADVDKLRTVAEVREAFKPAHDNLASLEFWIGCLERFNKYGWQLMSALNSKYDRLTEEENTLRVQRSIRAADTTLLGRVRTSLDALEEIETTDPNDFRSINRCQQLLRGLIEESSAPTSTAHAASASAQPSVPVVQFSQETDKASAGSIHEPDGKKVRVDNDVEVDNCDNESTISGLSDGALVRMCKEQFDAVNQSQPNKPVVKRPFHVLSKQEREALSVGPGTGLRRPEAPVVLDVNDSAPSQDMNGLFPREIYEKYVPLITQGRKKRAKELIRAAKWAQVHNLLCRNLGDSFPGTLVLVPDV